MEDLGFLSNQTKVYVMGLPSEAKSVVVNYSNGFRILVTIPHKKRKIRIATEYYCDEETEEEHLETEELEIHSPDLIFSSHYVDVPRFKQKGVVSNHAIFVHNTEVTDRIEVFPYLLANVHATGNICFGGFAKPSSPKEAFNLFWITPFNADLRGETEDELFMDEDGAFTEDVDGLDAIEFIEFYNKHGLEQQSWQDRTQEFTGTKFWASPQGADAILVSNEAKLLKAIPRKFWRKSAAGNPFVIALANNKGEYWEFTSGGFKFCLDSGFVTLHEQHSHQVIKLKKKFQLSPEGK